MDLEKDEVGRERHFVLHVMSLIYGFDLKPLQYCLQQKLDRYPREFESYCTKNVTRALIIYIIDFMDSNQTLVDLASPAFHDQVDDLLHMYNPCDFLRFLALYTLKSRREYYLLGLLDSPTKFYSSMERFLSKMRENNGGGVDFWKDLDKAAAEVVAKDLEPRYTDADFGDNENAPSVREFVLMLMKIVSNLYSNPLPDYLKRELDESMFMSYRDFPPNFKTALTIVAENIERNVYDFNGDDEPICEFFHRLATKSFNAKYFLEYLLCCTRRALLDYYLHSKELSPSVAFDQLCFILHKAKEDGKLHSVDALIKGADEIIAEEKMRIESIEAISEASTEFFSDVSTESAGLTECDCESLFLSFERSLSTTDSAKVTSKNAQPVVDSAIASASNAESTVHSVIASASNAEPTIHSVIASASNAEPTIHSVIASESDAQPTIHSVIASASDAGSTIRSVIASSSNAGSTIRSVIASSSNAGSTIRSVIASASNAESTIRSVIASSSNAESTLHSVITSSSVAGSIIRSVIVYTEDSQSDTEDKVLPKVAHPTVIANPETGEPDVKTAIPGRENGTSVNGNAISKNENDQPAMVYVTAIGENAHSSIESTTSGVYAANGETENLISSDQIADKRSCACCTAL